MDGWMFDGWMDGCLMDGWMDVLWMVGWMFDGWMFYGVCLWMVGRVDDYLEEFIDKAI